MSEAAGARSRISSRTEKSIRLVTASLVAACFGIAAVITDNEALGFVGPAARAPRLPLDELIAPPASPPL